MTQFNIIVNQIIVLGILVVIGFIATKFKIITNEIKDGIARIIVKITMPLLIFTSISSLNLTADMVKNGIAVLIFAFISLLLLYGCGILSSKLLGIKGTTQNVYIAHMMFGNVIFLGFPLFQALYPDGQGIFYAVFFNIASDTLLWTLGVYLLSKHTDSNDSKGLRRLANPNTIAFIIGLLTLLSGLKIPVAAKQALSGLGQTTIYLSMLFIGAALAGISLKGIYKRYSIFVLNIIKMIVAPIVIVLILNFVNTTFGLGISDVAKTVLGLQVAMPAMATVAVLANDYKSDYIYAAENVFVSTVLSLITLPLVFYIFGRL